MKLIERIRENKDNIRLWFRSQILGIVMGFTIGLLLSILGSYIYDLWDPLASKVPTSVHVKNNMHLSVQNVSEDTVAKYSTESPISKTCLLDVDDDGEDELLVATRSKRGKPQGRLILYDSGNWNEKFYVPESTTGRPQMGIEGFAVLDKAKALAVLVSCYSDWSPAKLVLLDFSGNPIASIKDITSEGKLDFIMACTPAEWDDELLLTFLVGGYGLYESHEIKAERTSIPTGDGYFPLHYGVAFYRVCLHEPSMGGGVSSLDPIWIFKVEPRGSVVKDFDLHYSDSSDKVDSVTFWIAGYEYKLYPTYPPGRFAMLCHLYPNPPKVEFSQRDPTTMYSRDSIRFHFLLMRTREHMIFNSHEPY